MIHHCENKECGLTFNRLTIKEKFCRRCRRSGIAYYKPVPIKYKECLICSKRFKTNKSSKLYCSKDCREAADTRSNAVMEKTCTFCGNKFDTTDSRKKYCDSHCYSLAKTERSKYARENDEASTRQEGK